MKRSLHSLTRTIVLFAAVVPALGGVVANANPARSQITSQEVYAQVPDVGAPRQGGSSSGGGVRSIQAPGRGSNGLGGGIQFKPPVLPPGVDGPGGSRSGGASRNGCVAVKTPLTALVPATEATATQGQATPVTSVWGLTVDHRPTLWFYVPYSKSTDLAAEFVLQDEDENDVYRSKVALPVAPGIVNVSVPSAAPRLEVGKTYRWYFNIYCDRQKSSPPIFVDGAIRRVQPDPQLTKQLASAKAQEQARLYANGGIWFNALTTLGNLRLANPNDPTLAANWASLLRSVGLEPVAKAPLVK